MLGRMRNTLLLSLVAVLCVACSSSGPGQTLGQAASTPVKDLNLTRADIPELLKAAKAAPYAMPAERSCPALAEQVRALDTLLEPDWDAPPQPKGSNTDRATEAAGGALVKAAEGAVPFRGWVRKLSGAERHSRHVGEALDAGDARRSFLKGMAKGQGC
jgi:hypothetical protein